MEKVEQRAFGLSGRYVSILGLGTVKFGRNTGVKYPQGFDLPDDGAINGILDLCIENGINLLDTAPAYGTAEERLGQLLGERRDKFFLVTKTGEEFDGTTSRHIFTREHTEMSVERSLRRLKTDHLDCVLVHSTLDDLDVIENTDVLETLHRLKGKGDIASFGVSTYTIAGGKKAADLCDCVMVAYNPDYREEESVIHYALEKKKAVLIKKAMGSGHAPDPARNLNFVARTPGVTSIVFGSLNPNNIRSNIAALNKDE
ncbi:MAG: Aldo/keto reductase [Micavibrio sp.]|nr:Aldo/keto reductase [Micavibrio sp.]